jgi:hypothetical protein
VSGRVRSELLDEQVFPIVDPTASLQHVDVELNEAHVPGLRT